MEADERRLVAIMRRLLERTEAREQDWEPDPNAYGAFLAALGRFQARIASEDEDDDSPFRFALLNERGDELDHVRTTTPPGDDSQAERLERIRANRLLRSLYSAARRRGIRIDEALDDVSRQLGLDTEQA